MVIDNIKELSFCIIVVGTLLLSCVSYDYADNNITVNHKENVTGNLTFDNNVSVIGVNKSSSNFVVKHTDKIYPKYDIITMTGKPSCQCGKYYSYKWYTKSYINYCPNCHHYNCLGNKHKYGARFEQEISCFRCDSDFCINCGHEKYSWSRVYLTRA